MHILSSLAAASALVFSYVLAPSKQKLRALERTANAFE